MKALSARLACALALLAPAAARAHVEGDPNASVAADFLRLGVSARAAAMGEAQAAVADDASALYYNPAAMTRVSRGSISLMHANTLEQSSVDFAGYVQKLGRRTAVGAALQHMSAGSIQGTDDLSGSTSEFTPRDIAAALGVAHSFGGGELEGFSVGLSGKLVRSQILDSAQTFAADVGALSPAYLGERLRVGFSMSNIGGRLRYQGEEFAHPLPRIARLGTSLRFAQRWTLALDGVEERGQGLYANAGTEYAVAREGAWNVAVRGGATSRNWGEVDDAFGLSGGFGASYKVLALDYAYVPAGTFGSVHRFSVTLNF